MGEKKVGFIFSEDLHTKFKTVAAERKISMKAATRQALLSWLDHDIPSKPAETGAYRSGNKGMHDKLEVILNQGTTREKTMIEAMLEMAERVAGASSAAPARRAGGK